MSATGSVRRRRSRGQALVEFTLAIPLFLLVFLGIAEGGYYVVATTIVSHATHEGARLGVLSSTSSRATVRTRVVNAASAIVGVANGDIAVCVLGKGCTNANYQTRDAGDRLQVTTTYTHLPLVSYVFSGISFPANAVAELRVEGAPSP